MTSPEKTLTPVWPLTVQIWRWYKANFRELMKVALWWLVALPFILPGSIMSLVGITPGGDAISQRPERFGVFLFFVILGVIASIVVAVIVRPALVTIIYSEFLKKKLPPRKAFLHAKDVLWQYVLVMILLGIAISLGFFAFFIPGVIIAIYLIFSEQAVILEGEKHIYAIKRSFELVKGHFWAVLWRFLFVNAVFYLGAALVSILLVRIPLALLSGVATGSLTLKLVVPPFMIIGAVISAVTIPLFLAVQVVLFKELQQLKK